MSLRAGVDRLWLIQIFTFLLHRVDGPGDFFARSVSGDDAAVLDKCPAGGAIDDGLGDILRIDEDNVGALPQKRAMRVQTHDGRTAKATELHHEREFVVPPEVGSVGEQHRAFQHVCVAERRPHVAYAVRSRCRADTPALHVVQWWKWFVAGCGGDDGHVQFGNTVEQGAPPLLAYHADAECMA